MYCITSAVFLFWTFFVQIQKIGTTETPSNLTIHVCGIIETGNSDLIVDYRKVAPAIDLGLSDANKHVLPAGVQLKFHYKDAGSNCLSVNHAFKNIMEFMADEITLNVYFGFEISEYSQYGGVEKLPHFDTA